MGVEEAKKPKSKKLLQNGRVHVMFAPHKNMSDVSLGHRLRFVGHFLDQVAGLLRPDLPGGAEP